MLLGKLLSHHSLRTCSPIQIGQTINTDSPTGRKHYLNGLGSEVSPTGHTWVKEKHVQGLHHVEGRDAGTAWKGITEKEDKP